MLVALLVVGVGVAVVSWSLVEDTYWEGKAWELLVVVVW